MGDKNRHFGREFKRDTVQLVTEKGMLRGESSPPMSCSRAPAGSIST